MKKLLSKSTFTLVTGILLFSIGFLGYAFGAVARVPEWYLLLNLVLGFWGIVVSVNKK